MLEEAIAEKIPCEVKIFKRKYGFQQGFRSAINLIDVHHTIREGADLVATLDLSMSYDRINREKLVADFDRLLSEELEHIITACLQQTMFATNGDVTGCRLINSLGQTQGSHLSPISFIIYINDI